MKLTFIGADHEVTGSCTYLEACGKRILIDYGMEQGKNFYENAPLPALPADVDAVLLTHAHIDHSGLLPLLFKNGYKAAVHATKATCNLCDIMLRDSAHIQEFEAEWRNRKGKRSGADPFVPLYTMEDAEGIIKQFVPHRYDERFTLFDGIEVRFTDAGHLLGSSHIELWLNENGESRKMVFSGDIGNINQPLLRDPSLVDEADFCMVESTYGDRLHEAPPDYAKALAAVLQKTFDRGGSVIVPSFAVGRTQEMLYFIRHIKTQGLVHGHDGFPVFVDSPLASKATRVFVENGEFCYDAEAKAFLDAGVNPLSFDGLTITQSTEESIAINTDSRSKVILSASGMCTAGRIKHHLKHGLWNANNTILFVGFQAYGTLGRALIEGADKVKLFGETIRVNAEIIELPGISGHADANMLAGWVAHYSPKPKHVFVNHGESSVCDLFAKRLVDELGVDATAPYSGSVYDLITDRYITQATPVMIESARERAEKAKEAASPYTRLLAALERLTKLIKGGKGRSNREIRSVTDQLESISDAWERK
jgi:metallo-beta-lactamase family protein